MIVITIDQRRSRRQVDKVETLLGRLNSAYPTVRPFQRTAGDELQAVLDDGASAAVLALDVAGSGEWSVGVGVGPVNRPLPRETRAGSGPAFEAAREAVERAKHAPASLAIRPAPALPDDVARRLGRVEAELQLVAEIARRRSPAATEAGVLVDQGLTQREAADRLGITQQAVSDRLSTGLWQPAKAVGEYAAQDLAAVVREVGK